MSESAVTVVFDLLGITAGLFSVGLLYTVKAKFGGKIANGLGFFIWGSLFQTLSFVYTLVFEKLIVIPAFVNVHHVLMAAGLLCVVFGARKFAELVR